MPRRLSCPAQVFTKSWPTSSRLTPILMAIFGSDDYIVRAASGDFCLPGAVEYQPLHSDMRDFVDRKATLFSSFNDPRGYLSIRDLPCPYVCVNFMPIDMTPLNGPTRQIPGTQHSRAPIPRLSEEPERVRLSTVCPAPAGAVQIRDVRARHGRTPELPDETRAIPIVEYYAPWFREPMLPGISRAVLERRRTPGSKSGVVDGLIESDTPCRAIARHPLRRRQQTFSRVVPARTATRVLPGEP